MAFWSFFRELPVPACQAQAPRGQKLLCSGPYPISWFISFYNKLVIWCVKGGLSLVLSHSTKLIKPKEGVGRTSNLSQLARCTGNITLGLTSE